MKTYLNMAVLFFSRPDKFCASWSFLLWDALTHFEILYCMCVCVCSHGCTCVCIHVQVCAGIRESQRSVSGTILRWCLWSEIAGRRSNHLVGLWLCGWEIPEGACYKNKMKPLRLGRWCPIGWSSHYESKRTQVQILSTYKKKARHNHV